MGRGYGSPAERFAKTRRLGVLRGRLGAAERALAAGHPSITVGGKRLWRTRHHLDAADLTEQQWRQRWAAARLFLTADGESGKAGGNETIRVDERDNCVSRSPLPSPRRWAPISSSPDRSGSATAASNGRRG